jgi:3-isopropylmalate/(R)-2-methylmalate dehydratase large subunit
MSGQTVAEKIISAHAGKRVYANDVAIVRVDGVMATDATAPLAIQAFRQMGGKRLWDASRVALVLDHATPAPNERVANLHRLMRDFAQETGCHFYDVGAGICHQLMVENAHVRPSDLFLGADSHTPTYGAVNALSCGVGSTDLAAAMLTGKTWLKVPQTLKVVLNGTLPKGITAKDVILRVLRETTVSGANYMAVEFTGEAVVPMTLASRMVLANMVAEMGAKCANVDAHGLSLPYSDWSPVFADENAHYARVLELDVSELVPMVAVPHAPDNVVPIDDVRGTIVHQAFIGSCTNARLEDLHAAADVLRGRKVAPHVRLMIAPASHAVLMQAVRDGTFATLTEAGAFFVTSGCGVCVGTHQGVPSDGEVVISSTNRNFKGRMGNPNAHIYLSSPAVVAASAVCGAITDPSELG